MSLPAITAVITASTEGFETAIGRAVRASATASQQISEHTEKISKSYERLQKVAEAAIAIFAVEKFASLVEGSVQAAEQLDRLSQRTGVAVETLGGIGFAAKQSGVDLESASNAFVKLDRSIAGAVAGNKESTAAFNAIGISLQTLKNSSPDQVLAATADKFASYEDGANKTALALALFGKAGAEIIPLLNQGGDALQANIQYYQRYSGVTQELAEKSIEFGDTQKKISLLTGAFANQLTADLLPAMQSLANAFLEAKEDGTTFQEIASGLAEIFKALAVAASYVVEYINQVRTRIGALAAQIVALKDLNIGGFRAVSEAMDEDLKRASANFDKFRAAIESNTPYNGTDKPATVPRARTAAPSIAKEAKEVVDPLKEYLDNINKEGLKLNFDVTNFDKFKGLAETSKLALVEFDLEFGKFSDAARQEKGLPVLTQQQKDYATSLAATVVQAAEALKQTKALYAFDESIKSLQLETSLVGKNNEEREISTRLLALEKEGVSSSSAEYQKRIPIITDAVHQLTLAQQQLQLASFAYGGAQAHDEAVFQLSLVGKTKDAIEYLTAARQIDLDVRSKAYNDQGELNDKSGDQLRALQAVATGKKAQLAADTAQTREAQRSALAGSEQFFAQYVEDAKDAASQVRGALTDAFSAAEDSFVQFATTGKISFASLAQSIESDVAKIGFKYLASQGIQAAQGAFGADSTIGKLLGAASGASGAGGAVGGLSTASSTAALTTFSTTVTAANAPLLALTEAATQAALALSTIAASGGASGVSGLAGAAGAAGDSDELGDLLDVLGSAMGNVFSGGNVVPFANGGVVSRPTIFPMRSGVGLMGEAGPEAIMPLKRGRGGKLGVALHGDSPTAVTNNYTTVNVPAPQNRDLMTARQHGEAIRRALG